MNRNKYCCMKYCKGSSSRSNEDMRFFSIPRDPVRFHDQEIAAEFDPHHLLKFVCNLFLKHDVMNVGFEVVVTGEELTGTLKWSNILKLYEIDGQNVLCCLLRDVTDRHMNPIAQDVKTA